MSGIHGDDKRICCTLYGLQALTGLLSTIPLALPLHKQHHKLFTKSVSAISSRYVNRCGNFTVARRSMILISSCNLQKTTELWDSNKQPAGKSTNKGATGQAWTRNCDIKSVSIWQLFGYNLQMEFRIYKLMLINSYILQVLLDKY